MFITLARRFPISISRLVPCIFAILASLIAGCTSSPVTPAPQPETSLPNAARAWCDQAPQAVTCLGEDSDVRLVVNKRTSDSSVVLWDPGGPGLGLPDPRTPLAQFIPAPIRNRNVAILVEPWMRKKPSQRCLESAFDGPPAASCPLAELTTSTHDLRSAVEMIKVETGLTVVGAYLQSFGATRTMPLVVELATTLDWVVLESPGPPVGTSVTQLSSARIDSLISLLTSHCDAAACRRRVPNTLRHLAQWGVSGEATGREIMLGIVALATQPESNADMLSGLAQSLNAGTVAASTAAELRRLSRRYEGKLSGQRVGDSVFGFWADTCPRLTGWAELAASTDPMLQAYAWVYRGCASESWDYAEESFSQSSAPTPTLMMTSRQDTVVPPSIQNLWHPLLEERRHVSQASHTSERSHATQDVRAWIDDHER